MKRIRVLLAVLAVLCFSLPVMAQPNLTSAGESSVAKLTYGPDRWVDLHLLFQMQYTNKFTWDSSATAGETESDGVWASDFAPRRLRVMFNGQLAPNVTFFIETDIMNTGLYPGKTIEEPVKAEQFSTKAEQYVVFLQDAYINYKIADEFQIAFGMILLPFMHHNRESAVSLLGLDYNTTSVNMSESTIWRDYGVEFRGLLARGMIDYRVGVFDGIERKAGSAGTDDDVNPAGLPRVTGRIQINLMDPETGFFYSGNYLGKKKIVSFGAGVDYMKEAVYNAAENTVEDYLAWTVDATIDYPINPGMVVAFQVAYVAYQWSPAFVDVEDAYSYYAQAGLLIENTFQPVLRYQTRVLKADGGDNITTYLHVGLNYFINGHNANIKIEYQHPLGENEKNNIDQADLPGEKKFTLQAQMFI